MTRLEQLRVDARLSREQLAHEVGIARNTITRIEFGRGARVETLAKLAAFFEVPASDLTREALPVTEKAA